MPMRKEEFGILRATEAVIGGAITAYVPEAWLAYVRDNASKMLTGPTVEELRRQYLPQALEATRAYLAHPPMSIGVGIAAGTSLVLEAIEVGREKPAQNLFDHLWRVTRAGAVAFGPHAAILFARNLDATDIPASLLDPEVLFYGVSVVLGIGRTLHNTWHLGRDLIHWPERRKERIIWERVQKHRHKRYLRSVLLKDKRTQ